MSRLPGRGWFWVAVVILAAAALAQDGGDEERDRGRAERAERERRVERVERGAARQRRAERRAERRARRRQEREPKPASEPRPRSPAVPADARRTRVTSVTDGDTVELAGLGPSRLIGIDTPEVFFGAECFGPRASAFTKRNLPPGTTVYIRRGVERRDRYGRDLVYVWLEGGTFFNALLAKQGFATALAIAPNTEFAALFRRLASAAREAGRGLWGAC